MFMLLFAGLIGYDIESGLKAGEKVPELKAFGLVGDIKEKSADFAKERGELPTVYLFVNNAKFDRPMAQYFRELDRKVGDAAEKSQIVIVWIGGDLENHKTRLPYIHGIFKLDRTSIAAYEGEAPGPNGWGLNADAHLTTIVAHKGKVIKSFAYESVNETAVPKVLDELKKAK
jgi:hypothetical protein